MADNLEVVGLEFDTREYERAIQRAERRLDSLEDAVDSSGKAADRAQGQFEGLGRKVLKLAAAYGVFRALESTTRFIFNTNVEFQKLQATLGTVTGSAEAGAQAFGLITDFARTTPFEIANLTQAFIGLRVRGFDPTRDDLKGLGNFASAFTADITDLSDAIVSASAGMTRPLRRFGIDAQVTGDKITLSFKGVSRTMENTAENVSKFLAEMGNTQFPDAMADRMQTLDGAISNLADTTSLLAKKMGDAGLNAELVKITRSLDDMISNADGLASAMGTGLAAALGKVADAGRGWLIIAEGLARVAGFGENPNVTGTKLSLSHVTDVRTLQKRYGEFSALMPSPKRTIQENDQVLKNAGMTASDVSQILMYIEQRITELVHAGGGGGGGAGGGGVNPAQDAIDKITASLEQQRRELELGAEAGFRYELAQQGITGAAQDQVVTAWKHIQTLKDEQQAKEDAAKEDERRKKAVDDAIAGLKEQNIELSKGEKALVLHRLAAQGATAQQLAMASSLLDANQALQDQADQARELKQKELAELQAEYEQIKQAADRMAEDIVSGLEDIVAGTGDVVDAFAQMLREIERLVARRTITEPLANWISGLLDAAMGGGGGGGGGGTTSNVTPGVENASRITRPSFAGSSGQAVVVNQTQNVNVAAIDAPGVAALLRQHKGVVLEMMAEGVRESDALRAALRGG